MRLSAARALWRSRGSPTDPGSRVVVTFRRFAPSVFPYAYNIPRPRFDDLLLKSAIACGVRHVPIRAQLQAASQPGAVGKRAQRE